MKKRKCEKNSKKFRRKNSNIGLNENPEKSSKLLIISAGWRSRNKWNQLQIALSLAVINLDENSLIALKMEKKMDFSAESFHSTNHCRVSKNGEERG